VSVTALRWLLRLMLAAGLIVLASGLSMSVRPEAPAVEGMENESLPDLSAFAEIALVALGVAATAPALLGLFALRRTSPWAAGLFLALVGALGLYAVVLMLGKAGMEASVSGWNWLMLAVPGWWLLLVFLATTPDSLATLGLQTSWSLPTRSALAVLVTALVGWTVWSAWRSPAADRAVASLRFGQPWRETIERTSGICVVGRSDSVTQVMWLRCPAADLGSRPLVSTYIELHYDRDSRLASWRRRPLLEFPR
jgi:hypothetical protein